MSIIKMFILRDLELIYAKCQKADSYVISNGAENVWN